MPKFGTKFCPEHHPHHTLFYDRNIGLYICDGCCQNGFNAGYTCHECGFVLHDECSGKFNVDIKTKHFGCTFRLMKAPTDCEVICDTCGEAVNHYVYRCRDAYCKISLHPPCANLPRFIQTGQDGELLQLTKKLNSNCFRCNQKKLPGRKSNWAYVSSSIHIHVACIWDMITEQGKRGFVYEASSSSSLPITNVPRITNAVPESGLKALRFNVVSAIATALRVVDPTVKTMLLLDS